MRHTVHVVDFGGHKQLADIGEYRIGHYRAGRVLRAVDRGCDAAGIEALGDGDQLDHRLADVPVAFRIEAVGLDHERTRADQEVAETRASTDAGMPMMRRIGRGQETALFRFAGQENPGVRDEHVVEDHDADGLAVLG